MNKQNSAENISKNETIINNTSKEKIDSEDQFLLNLNKKSLNNKNSIDPPNNRKIKKMSNLSEPTEEIFSINRQGNMSMFLFNKKGEPLIVIGPNWRLAITMKIIIDICSFCYFYFLWNTLFKFMLYIGLIIFSIQSGVYLIIILMNPGIPSKELWLENYNNSEEIGTYRICNICKIIMINKDKTDHCEECNVCIIGADHHCPWTSKCIGKRNKTIFYIFVFSTFVLLIYFFCGTIVSLAIFVE